MLFKLVSDGIQHIHPTTYKAAHGSILAMNNTKKQMSSEPVDMNMSLAESLKSLSSIDIS